MKICKGVYLDFLPVENLLQDTKFCCMNVQVVPQLKQEVYLEKKRSLNKSQSSCLKSANWEPPLTTLYIRTT